MRGETGSPDEIGARRQDVADRIGMAVDPHQFDLAQLRREAYDLDTCPNGPDEDGSYPCDPKVLLGGGYAECQACGRVAAWGRDTTKAWARG